MGLSNRNLNLRAPERTFTRVAEVQQRFHPYLRNRTETVIWMLDKFWELLSTPTTLIDVLNDWQAFIGNKRQHDVAQMNLHFPPHRDSVSFYPKIGNKEIA